MGRLAFWVPLLPLLFIIATNGTGQKKCDLSKLDLFFVIDNSLSVRKGNFKKVQQFMKRVVNMLDVGEDGSRVSTSLFNQNAVLTFSLEAFTERSSIHAAINRLNCCFLGTCTGKGMNNALDGWAASGEKRLSKLMIVITDGENSKKDNAQVARAKKRAKAQGVEILVVGVRIKRKVAMKKLEAFTDHPSKVRFPKDFNDLGSNETLHWICEHIKTVEKAEPKSCADAPCENGGKCLEDEPEDGYWCECPNGFSGDRCQKRDESDPGEKKCANVITFTSLLLSGHHAIKYPKDWRYNFHWCSIRRIPRCNPKKTADLFCKMQGFQRSYGSYTAAEMRALKQWVQLAGDYHKARCNAGTGCRVFTTIRCVVSQDKYKLDPPAQKIQKKCWRVKEFRAASGQPALKFPKTNDNYHFCYDSKPVCDPNGAADRFCALNNLKERQGDYDNNGLGQVVANGWARLGGGAPRNKCKGGGCRLFTHIDCREEVSSILLKSPCNPNPCKNGKCRITGSKQTDYVCCKSGAKACQSEHPELDNHFVKEIQHFVNPSGAPLKYPGEKKFNYHWCPSVSAPQCNANTAALVYCKMRGYDDIIGSYQDKKGTWRQTQAVVKGWAKLDDGYTSPCPKGCRVFKKISCSRKV